jgi:hypothetical protein
MLTVYTVASITRPYTKEEMEQMVKSLTPVTTATPAHSMKQSPSLLRMTLDWEAR